MPVKYTPILAWKAQMVEGFPKQPGVYLIMCTATGKRYIGATSNLRRRVYDHLSLMAVSEDHSPMGADYKTYGYESFEACILEVIEDKSTLQAREKYWIANLLTEDNSYNTEPSKKNRHWD